MILAMIAVPFGLQAAAMLADEFYFHRRRGLPRWERLGHPLDALIFLAALAVIAAAQPSRRAMEVYAAVAALSCLSVTKDEFVHAGLCSGGEHWVHSVSFILHPVVLGTNALLWPAVHGMGRPGMFLRSVPAAQALFFVRIQIAAAAAFAAYQTVYWNFSWKTTVPGSTP